MLISCIHRPCRRLLLRGRVATRRRRARQLWLRRPRTRARTRSYPWQTQP
jgi:hypothetical protein